MTFWFFKTSAGGSNAQRAIELPLAEERHTVLSSRLAGQIGVSFLVYWQGLPFSLSL